jgi:polyisoprenoid-binding protein YceI
MKRLLLLAGLTFGISAIIPPAFAAEEMLQLTPGNMLAQTHSHAIMFNIAGTFRKLSGTLTFDPVTHACAIDAVFIVRSLTAPTMMVRAQVMSKDFLDPAQYPTMRFQGACRANGTLLAGTLTMHGQTHPFAMNMTDVMKNGQLTGFNATGTLNRYAWGLNGLKMLVGPTITVTNKVSLDGKPPRS